MKIIEDNDRRTVLLFRPPMAMPMSVCLAVLFFTGWGWRATQSWKWFAAFLVAMGFVIMRLASGI